MATTFSNIHVESICPLCGESTVNFVFSEKNHDLVKCQTCGLFFIIPYPQNQHDAVMDYSYKELRVTDAETQYQAEKSHFKYKFEEIDELVRGARCLLDVGCGTGHLLELMKNRHPTMICVGVELNRKRADLAKMKCKCEIHQIPVEDMPVDQTFDAIVLYNVLSHIPFLDNFFLKIKALLNPLGKLVIVAGEYGDTIKKNDVFEWGIPDHLHFLGMTTIDYVCEKYEFQKVLHKKNPLSQELFSKSFFLSPGRSKIRNIVKNILVHIPFALSFFSYIYDNFKGKKIFSSTLILTLTKKQIAK